MAVIESEFQQMLINVINYAISYLEIVMYKLILKQIEIISQKQNTKQATIKDIVFQFTLKDIPYHSDLSVTIQALLMFLQQQILRYKYKRMSKIDNPAQDQVWYIYINEETRGPLGLRDLDVLLRTNQINSKTFCWKNTMKEWKPMIEIQELKQSIIDSSNEIPQLEKKTNFGDKPANAKENGNQNGQKIDGDQQQDHMIENQDENPLTILEVTVDNLIKKSFLQSEDGKWSIYDEQKQQWVLQDEQPIQKIAQMKNFLMNKLKSEFFADEKNRRKYKHPAATAQEPEKPLTKEQIQKKQRNKKKAKRAAQKKKQKWYQAKINTFVYISGLPIDITEEELKQFVSKAGVLRMDLSTGKQKLKIYKDENDVPKGDAAVSYARQQSVQIALQMLNDSQIRNGFKVKVERALFNQKDQQYKKRQTKKQTKIKKLLAKKNEERLLGWDDEIQQKGEGFRIVIMKYVFTPQQSSNEVQMAQIKADITEQLGKIGQIKRIRFFENHPDGVVEIKFEKDIDAERCIQIMNNRFFDQRKILCQYWDGETDYKLDANSIALQQERLLAYANQLQTNQQDQKKGKQELKTIKQNQNQQASNDNEDQNIIKQDDQKLNE